jgi:hypothetical protein
MLCASALGVSAVALAAGQLQSPRTVPDGPAAVGARSELAATGKDGKVRRQREDGTTVAEVSSQLLAGSEYVRDGAGVIRIAAKAQCESRVERVSAEGTETLAVIPLRESAGKDCGGRPTLIRVDAASGSSVTIARPQADAFSLSLSQDGSAAYVTLVDAERPVIEVVRSDGTVRRLAADAGCGFSAAAFARGPELLAVEQCQGRSKGRLLRLQADGGGSPDVLSSDVPAGVDMLAMNVERDSALMQRVVSGGRELLRYDEAGLRRLGGAPVLAAAP